MNETLTVMLYSLVLVCVILGAWKIGDIIRGIFRIFFPVPPSLSDLVERDKMIMEALTILAEDNQDLKYDMQFEHFSLMTRALQIRYFQVIKRDEWYEFARWKQQYGDGRNLFEEDVFVIDEKD